MLTAIIVLGIIVLFHEFGHFLLARINGVQVIEFSVGFGPRLLTHVSKKSNTRYSLKILPLGGSCAMLGEDEYEEEAQKPADGGADSVGERRESGGEDPGSPEEFSGCSFQEKSAPARFSIIAAGPVFNFIMAFVFALVIILAVGYDYPQLLGVTEGYPAEAAGILAGDVVTKLGDRKVTVTRDINMYLMIHPGETTRVEYKRQDAGTGEWSAHTAVISPKYSVESGSYLLGFQLNAYRNPVKNFAQAVGYAAYEVQYWIRSVFDSFGMMFRGQVNADDLAGPIRIITMIDETVEESKEFGLVTVLLSLANMCVLLSANLGVMNLLPIPALDGGRIVFILFEMIRGKPVSQKLESAVNLTGMALLMMFMAMILFNDIRNIF